MSEPVVAKLAEAASEAPVFCAWVGMNEPAVAEALAREAFDAVVLDMQHGAFDFAGASRAILAVALAGKPARPSQDFTHRGVLVDDLASIGPVLQHLVERATGEGLAAIWASVRRPAT